MFGDWQDSVWMGGEEGRVIGEKEGKWREGGEGSDVRVKRKRESEMKEKI